MPSDYKDEYFLYDICRGKSYYEESPDELFKSPGTYYELVEYYHRNLGDPWYVSTKKSAAELLTINDYLCRGVIIQRGDRFYVFVDDPDIKEFAGLTLVNEIILKQRSRYPTIDIDSKVPTVTELIKYFSDFVDCVDDIYIFVTTSGYHISLRSILLDYNEHRDLLNKVAADKPTWGIDVIAALNNIKLVGTRSSKPGSIDKQLIYPTGGEITSSSLLSCPISTQQVYEKITSYGSDDKVSTENDSISEDEFEKISSALTGQINQITGVTGGSGNMVSLSRRPGSYCNLCKRPHGVNRFGGFIEGKCIDAFVMVYSDRFVVGCFNATTRIKIIIDRDIKHVNDLSARYERYLRSFQYRSADYPGEFPEKTPDCSYIEPPIHENGQGCKVVLFGDYIDGSACGMGKSEAAWKSIRPGESVLDVSYRKTLTEKTRADHNLECYSDIRGDIVFNPQNPRRIITQVESIVRVRGIPDVLILDEFHGILRQIMTSPRSKEIWSVLAGLTSSGCRIIVLDALINNDDFVLFKKFLNRPDMVFINNDYKPDHDKKFIVEQNHYDNRAASLEVLRRGGDIVVVPHNKRHGDFSVEGLAKFYQHHRFPLKYYHADTDPDEKQRDFANPVEAFKDSRVIIYNKTLEAGVSIVDERFKNLFCFSESIGSVEATKQSLHRFRCVKEIHYSTSLRSSTDLPLTRDDIMAAIESRERNCSAEELLFRAPNFHDLNTGYGYAFISVVLDENNSRRCYTGRLVEMMKRSGFTVEWALPDEYDIWLAKENKKKERIPQDSPAIDDFLKSSVGERIIQSRGIVTESIKYHRYDPEQRLEPYQKKLMYLNHVFQTDVSKLGPDQVEHLLKNIPRMQRYQRLSVDKFNNGRAVGAQPFRSDKITPRQQLEIIRDVLGVLKLPDVVPDRLDVKSVPVNRAELINNINDMLGQPDLVGKYQTLLKYFNEIFPDVYFRKGTLTVKNIIEKIKTIYKEFGGKLQSDDKGHAKRSDYTLYYPEWPKSDFIDDPMWLNETIDGSGFAGKDVNAVDEHTTMLKFHIWTVNGWFSRYDPSD